MEILNVKKLSKKYGKGENEFLALNNVSFKVQKGEFIVIVGKSGSGKSTLLHLLGGLDKPSSGSVFINNQDIYKMSDKNLTVFRRKYIGIIYQFYNLIPVLSVKENILMGTTQENVRELDEVCRRADIWEIEEENDALSLSGGQAQRVNIARGMLNKAPLLLADEPDAGLPLAQGEIIMKNILSSSDTVIVITHHYQYLDLFTRVLLIEDGKLIADNAPEQIKSHPGYISWRGEVD